jgi:hypothetical protein
MCVAYHLVAISLSATGVIRFYDKLALVTQIIGLNSKSGG